MGTDGDGGQRKESLNGGGITACSSPKPKLVKSAMVVLFVHEEHIAVTTTPVVVKHSPTSDKVYAPVVSNVQ